MRALAVIATLAACDPGRGPARTALDGYRRVVKETCACRSRACIGQQEDSWAEVSAAADRDHARFMGEEDIWLVDLELAFRRCRANVLGQEGDFAAPGH